MSGLPKNDIAELKKIASEIVARFSPDLTKPINISAMVTEMKTRTGCHYDTAKKHIRLAISAARGEQKTDEFTDWGGSRGGGRGITKLV